MTCVKAGVAFPMGGIRGREGVVWVRDCGWGKIEDKSGADTEGIVLLL